MFDVLTGITYSRGLKHWSVCHLAQLSGIPQSAVAIWYQKGLYPPIDKLETLYNAFGTTPSELFQADNRSNLGEGEQVLLNKWSRLRDHEKVAVLEIIDVILQESQPPA